MQTALIGHVHKNITLFRKQLDFYQDLTSIREVILLGNIHPDIFESFYEEIYKHEKLKFWMSLSGQDNPEIKKQEKPSNLTFFDNTYHSLINLGSTYGLDHSFDSKDQYHNEDNSEKIYKLYLENTKYSFSNYQKEYSQNTWIGAFVFNHSVQSLPYKQMPGSLALNQLLQHENVSDSYCVITPHKKAYVKLFKTAYKPNKVNLFAGVPPLEKNFICVLNKQVKSGKKEFTMYAKPYNQALITIQEKNASK